MGSPGTGAGSGDGGGRGPLVARSVYGRRGARHGEAPDDLLPEAAPRRVTRRGVVSGLGIAGFLAAAGGTGAWLDRRRPGLPGFVAGAPAEVRASYAFAAEEPETLRFIPCYCACGRDEGHGSVLECYVSGKDAFGRPRWDRHGASCSVSTTVVGLVRQRRDGGTPLAQIRREVDAAFAHLVSDATETGVPGEGHGEH